MGGIGQEADRPRGRLRLWTSLGARLELAQEPKGNGNVDFLTLADSCGAAGEKGSHLD